MIDRLAEKRAIAEQALDGTAGADPSQSVSDDVINAYINDGRST